MKVTRSIWATGAAALALQGAVQTLAAQPAAAALPGAVARSAQSQFDSQRAKSVTASCPVGTRVTGGSGRVIGVPGHVVLTRMEPQHTNNPTRPDGYTVTAEEDQTAPTGTWAVAAYVLCSAPLPGQQIVGARTDPASPQNRRAAVNCPAGKIALGSGARINGGRGQVHITEMTAGRIPSTGISTAFATGQEDSDGFGGNWQLQVFAVCASIAPQRQVDLSSFGSGTSDPNVKRARVTCPPGMTVSGGGVEIQDGFSGGVLLEALVPEFLVGGIPGNKFDALARKVVNNPNVFFSLRVEASCIN